MPRHLIPETFRLGKNWWRVEFLPPDEMKEFCPRYSTIRGWCDGEERTIYLADNLKGRRLIQTFLHEVTHSIEMDFGIAIPHRLVYSLERHLGNFVWDNFLTKRRRRK